MFREILKGKNIFRALLFQALKDFFILHVGMQRDAHVLEIGSDKASHQRALPRQWILHSANAKKMSDSEYVFDANTTFPFTENSFDGVVLFNTMYLIDTYEKCIAESVRVAKSFVMFNIPLVSGIAKDPLDYNRFTRDRIEKMQKDMNMGDASWEIMPIGGSFSGCAVLIDPYLAFRPLRIICNCMAYFLDKLDAKIKRDAPIQYLVYIKKN